MAKEETNTGQIHAPLMTEKEDIKIQDKLIVKTRYGSLRTKILFTVFIYVVYIAHGINDNLLGPSLIDLEYLTNSSTSSIAATFTWRYGGYFLGTIIAGPVVDRINEFFIIGVALCSMSIATFLTPLWRQLLGLFITSGGAGIATAFNSVCTSATILAIWGKDAKPYLQALHFFITIGWALSPQMIKPFLRFETKDVNKGHVIRIGNSDNITMEHDNRTMYSSIHPNSTLISTPGKISSESHIQYCYIVVASCLMLLSILSFVIVISKGCKLQKGSDKGCVDNGKKSMVDGKARIIILLLLFSQAFMYGGIEMAYASLTMTFVVKYLKLSKSMGSDISTLFMAMVATSRVLCVVLSKFIQPPKLLFLQLATLLGGTLITTFAVKLHWIVPWIGFAAAGLGMGSLFPTLLNWAHGYMTVKGKETAILYSGAGLTAMTVPPLTGFLFERVHPMWFIYLSLILTSVFIVLYLVNLILVHSLLKKRMNERCRSKENDKLRKP